MKLAKPVLFERRLFVISHIVKSKQPVSNIDLQLKFGLTKEYLNTILVCFREWGYIQYVKSGNSYLYTATDFAKTIFKED